MKHDWLQEIIFGNNYVSLEFKTFARILLDTLHKLIGLKSDSFWGKSTFGIMTRHVWEINFGTEDPWKKATTAL